mmetsp:Transcript_19592/g.31151  ORF Transcript_19592/g.31151 Transcript_19592/m.31151 type:complete len:239 (+) Transcript_19592:116-832(+)
MSTAKKTKTGGTKRKLEKSENVEPAMKKPKVSLPSITKREFMEHAEPMPVKLSNGLEFELKPRQNRTGSMGFLLSEHVMFALGAKKVAVQMTINATATKSKDWDEGDVSDGESEKNAAKKKKATPEKGDTFTKKEFKKLAKTMKVTMFGEEFEAEVKETKKGGMQWTKSGIKIKEYELNGHQFDLQVSINFTCKRSTDWKSGSDEDESESGGEESEESEDDDVKETKTKTKTKTRTGS